MDEIGRPLRVIITSGTVNDCTKTIELIEDINHNILIADRAYDTNLIVTTCLRNGVETVIPSKKNRKEQRYYDKKLYKVRRIVENVFAVLKRWRGISTRYAKHTKSYLASVQIACFFAWANSIVDTP